MERLAPTSTDLSDDEVFRPFSECPQDSDILSYLSHFRETDGVRVPRRHWCFLGEITDKIVLTRLCLTVKDIMGKEVIASFYLDPRWQPPGMFSFPVHHNVPKSLTNKGNTMAILYAEQHDFLDGSTGFRIEDADQVQFFPCTLERLFALGDRISSSDSQSAGVHACNRCNTTVNTRRCSGCHVTWYCGKDCQVGDWSDGGHKKDCKLLNQVATLMRQDWENFHESYSFPLQVRGSQ